MAYWGNDALWQQLTGPQRAAAMALLEAEVGPGGINTSDARNALGAIINRSEDEGQSLSNHVSRSIYQPIIEENQRSRLPQILNSPEFKELTALAESRVAGTTPDWVSGADHYLAPPGTMLKLYNENPDKYHNWGPFANSKGVAGRNWTGYNPETGQYNDVVLKDNSHHFLNLLNKDGNPPTTAPTDMALPANTVMASAAPANSENRAMLPFLSDLFSASAASGATPLGTLGGGGSAPLSMGSFDGANLTGLLAPLFGGKMEAAGGQASGGSDIPQLPQTSSSGMQPIQRKPIDMQQLQALIASRPMLNMKGFTA